MFPLTYRPDEHDAFLDEVAEWLRSDAIGWLLDRVAIPVALGRPDAFSDPSASFADLVGALGELSDWRAHGTAWDMRRRGERQLVEGPAANGDHRLEDAEVRLRATELGMRSSRKATKGHHHLAVVMGGARMAPLRRAEWLGAQLAEGRIEVDHLTALGCNRPLSGAHERDLTYAGEHATTEIDLLEGALTMAIGAPPRWERSERARGVGDDHRTHWSWRTAPGVPIGKVEMHLVEAPTTRADRSRVDTAESLEFLAAGRAGLAGRELEVPEATSPGIAELGLGLGEGDSVVLSTAPIYSAYTQLVAVRVLGLKGCRVETMAHPLSDAVPASPVAPQYVQEVRSAVQAALDLADALVT